MPPKLARDAGKLHIDLDTVKAVISNRFQIMSHYYHRVVRPILKHERSSTLNKADKRLFQRAGRLLRRQDILLSPRAKTRLQTLLEKYEQIRVVYNYRQSLQNIWLKTASSQKELVDALQQWCKQAEESGLDVLRQFALHIRGYVLQPAKLS